MLKCRTNGIMFLRNEHDTDGDASHEIDLQILAPFIGPNPVGASAAHVDDEALDEDDVGELLHMKLDNFSGAEAVGRGPLRIDNRVELRLLDVGHQGGAEAWRV
ncbi:Hypothetical predicted protein [Prunus dulcis]|uniref:Uncharacterized protein n=1 Tax=Prunus dulcis TaxID=3755 RepID=A0A5E4F1R1_PRUDU|nr:Hypothetical predicted protein [Prunus dulcis]